MKMLWVLAFLFLVALFPCEARILNPEEARALLHRMHEQTVARDYWGIWQFDDGTTEEKRFVETFFLRGVGFAWRELGRDETVNVRFGNCRYVVDLKSKEVKSVYPILEFPFVPFEREDIPLLLENYLFDLRERELTLFSKRTMEAVCSFLLGEEGDIVGQRVYAPQGEVLEEWKLLYRDTSPEFSWIAPLLHLLESFREKIPQPEPLALGFRGEVFLPEFIPPGFQLRRAYLLKDGTKQFYGFVYSDGLLSFLLLQSVYPFQVSGSNTFRYFLFAQEKGKARVAAEKRGFYFLLVGGLDPHLGQKVLQSLSERGGRK